eukprot:236196_1
MISTINSMHICNKRGVECSEINKLGQMLTECINDHEKHIDNITSILNYSNHFLLFHHTDNDKLEIANKFSNDWSCKSLKFLKRRIRNDKIPIDSKSICLIDFVDTIHSYIFHSYNIGYRFRKHKQLKINNNVDIMKHNNIDEYSTCHKSIRKYRQQLRTKRIVAKNQKFNSNLNLCANSVNTSKISHYSYSFPFIYKTEFRHSRTKILNWRCYDLYVPSKYKTIKDELLNNEICVINCTHWDMLYTKAMIHIKSDSAKCLAADTENYLPDILCFPDHPIHFGYTDGSPIQINHLISLLIYCGYDIFQCRFSETCRKMQDDETLQSIVSRHSHFYHFAKSLKESVHVFGTRYIQGNIAKFYHGIDIEMVFDSTTPEIFGPLSTSCDLCVACNFMGDMGMVVELIPDAELKYFCCYWLSDFYYEQEVLFFGGFGRMNIVNIINRMGEKYYLYIQALRMIDTMTQGVYFMPNSSDVHKIKKYNYCKDLSKLGLQQIDSMAKLCYMKLICDKFDRDGVQINNRLLHRSLFNVNGYIRMLFDQICKNKQWCVINWNAMNVNILDKCDDLSGGYIGYSFMKSLFVENDCEW